MKEERKQVYKRFPNGGGLPGRMGFRLTESEAKSEEEAMVWAGKVVLIVTPFLFILMLYLTFFVKI